MSVCGIDGLLVYLIPLVPIVARLAVVARFSAQMRELPTEEEQDRDAHRTLIIAFAGFSFTGVVALVVLESAVRQNLKFAVFFLLISFLVYLSALNLQAYKADRWQGELGTALSDTGSLCLVCALISLLLTSGFGGAFAIGASALAGGVWLLDEILRLRFDWMYLAAEESVKPKEGGSAGEEEGGQKEGGQKV